jgi:hypothetical protein
MSYYGQAPRPKFWYRDNYVDVLPCTRWPCGTHTTLGQFEQWYQRQRAKAGGRIGEPYDKAMPKLRKSQVRTWRRFRFEANRDLRLQGAAAWGPSALRSSWEFNERNEAVIYAAVEPRRSD